MIKPEPRTGRESLAFAKLAEGSAEKVSIAFRLHSTPLKAFVEAVLARPSTTDLDEMAGLADLIASHGSEGEPKPLPLDGPLRAQLVDRLREWAQVCVDQAASVSRSQRSRIVRAIGRVPDTRFIPLLAELLEQEIVQRRAAKAARAARPFSPPADDGTKWYFHDFLRAFAATPGEASKAVLLPKLADPDFGVEAAQALRTIADIEAHGPSERGDGTTAPTFADVEARRLQRERGEEPAPSPIAAANDHFRDELYERYLGLPWGRAATTLASVIAERPDDRAVIVLIEGYAKRGPHFDGMIERAIEHLALGRRASTDWAGATELFGASVSSLRRTLLAMTIQSGPEAAIARVALTVIDSLRDRHGQVETEPRHPDLDSGIPWPLQ